MQFIELSTFLGGSTSDPALLPRSMRWVRCHHRWVPSSESLLDALLQLSKGLGVSGGHRLGLQGSAAGMGCTWGWNGLWARRWKGWQAVRWQERFWKRCLAPLPNLYTPPESLRLLRSGRAA